MNGSDITFETRCLSSLEKVFADEELTHPSFSRATSLQNEVFSFQVAYRFIGEPIKNIGVEVKADFQTPVQVRMVGLVPSEYPSFHDHDDQVLRTAPGLYPDPLYPIGEEGMIGYPNQWRSVWFTVPIDSKDQPGIHEITIVFNNENGDKLAEEQFLLEVVPVELPQQQLIHTEWFHTDCLAVYYDVDVFSEGYWELVDQYVKTAADHGINMILTPLFTPPLDTEVGGERPTVQLIGVEKHGDEYCFSFDKLTRWIEICSNRGIQYFEFSHFFTQWGAYHAPKIVAVMDGQEQSIFGWDTDATGEDYQLFLSQFLPQLVKYIKNHHLEKQVYFHISDEPNTEHLESYRRASELIFTHLAEFPIIDALSDYEFYKKGLVKQPIPATDHIEPFLDQGVPNLWTYYCNAQYKEVSNRFFNFPSVRTRILGLQLYKHDIKGFLHWGYNFWFSQYSRKPIDPFKNTDADISFPSGDAFLVYPGEKGPIESLRLEVFFDALQDVRALKLLEGLIGRDEVISLLENQLEHPITFKQYPCQSDWLLGIREQINRKIAESI
ncbi:DUF4091 domain-containing protein [Bacillus sp. S3]|uniref:DUF4091 domain-containing protein n=1 Tax=Bacillus sp. S3 TaxID=486398 RepID=UPI001188B4BD|nr:DUF4091 domain-containing protein [Bacillus sp. S3]QCJ44302.1 DUF4091 domain-containing protein [Bacillus sp. S3]